MGVAPRAESAGHPGLIPKHSAAPRETRSDFAVRTPVPAQTPATDNNIRPSASGFVTNSDGRYKSGENVLMMAVKGFIVNEDYSVEYLICNWKIKLILGAKSA